MRNLSDSAREVNLSSALTAAVMVLVGVIMLILGAVSPNASIREAVLGQVGGLLLATGVLTIAWELVGRRAFAREVLARANLKRDLVDTGLVQVTRDYLRVDWAELFDGSTRLDLVIAYAQTWRNSHTSELTALLTKSDAQLRVFLPHPDDDPTVNVLADRFAREPDDVRRDIREAASFFHNLASGAAGSVQVYRRCGDVVFSCYRFNSRAVLTLYSHGRKRRSDVPTFVVSRGQLWDFVSEQIESIESQSELWPNI